MMSSLFVLFVFINLTQDMVFWEEGTLIEKGLWSCLLGTLLINGSIGRAKLTVVVLWQVALGYRRSRLHSHEEQDNDSILHAFRSCPDFC